jgi:hypothetical protein
MNHYFKDIVIAALLLIGIAVFINGDFIVSSVVFAIAAIFSNIYRSELEPIIRNKKSVM